VVVLAVMVVMIYMIMLVGWQWNVGRQWYWRVWLWCSFTSSVLSTETCSQDADSTHATSIPSSNAKKKKEQTVDSHARTVNIRVANAVGTANVIVDKELDEAFVAKIVRANTCSLTHAVAVDGVHHANNFVSCECTGSTSMLEVQQRY
jgi:hypothetical protein